MQLSAYAYTNRGGRDHNEDSLRASAEQGIFVLADGLGGHRCGEVASQAAVDAIFTGMAQAEALEEAGLPTLLLDGDSCDRGFGGEGQAATRMEAFLEVLEGMA